jgi:hypothetical protein
MSDNLALGEESRHFEVPVRYLTGQPGVQTFRATYGPPILRIDKWVAVPQVWGAMKVLIVDTNKIEIQIWASGYPGQDASTKVAIDMTIRTA